MSDPQPPADPPADVRRLPTEPLDVDGVRTAVVGTVVWAVAFVVLVPFASRLADEDRLWWLWTCLVGVALGLVAIGITRRRRARMTKPPDPPGEVGG